MKAVQIMSAALLGVIGAALGHAPRGSTQRVRKPDAERQAAAEAKRQRRMERNKRNQL